MSNRWPIKAALVRPSRSRLVARAATAGAALGLLRAGQLPRGSEMVTRRVGALSREIHRLSSRHPLAHRLAFALPPNETILVPCVLAKPAFAHLWRCTLSLGTFERSADTVPNLTRKDLPDLNATPKVPSAFLIFWRTGPPPGARLLLAARFGCLPARKTHGPVAAPTQALRHNCEPQGREASRRQKRGRSLAMEPTAQEIAALAERKLWL